MEQRAGVPTEIQVAFCLWVLRPLFGALALEKGLWPEAWMNREGWLAREGGAVPVSKVRRVRETEAQIHLGVVGYQGPKGTTKLGSRQVRSRSMTQPLRKEVPMRPLHAVLTSALMLGLSLPGPDSLGLL